MYMYKGMFFLILDCFFVYINIDRNSSDRGYVHNKENQFGNFYVRIKIMIYYM